MQGQARANDLRSNLELSASTVAIDYVSSLFLAKGFHFQSSFFIQLTLAFVPTTTTIIRG